MALLFSPSVYGDSWGGGLTDYYGNGITSNQAAGTRNGLDIEILVSGAIVDPRSRTWSLINTTDSVNSVQSGTWTTGRTWTLLNTTDSVNSVQSGTWTTGRTWSLSSGTDSVSATQGTSPWVSNITQFGGVGLSTGTGASGTGIPRVTVSNDSNILATQSGTWTVQQGGTPTTVGNSWTVKPTDGTNVITFKAASTTPVIADTALVTSERPDNVGTPTMASVSCALTSTTLLAAGTATNFLSIRNPTTSLVTVWIRFDGSAAAAAVPSIDLPPGAEADFFAFGTSFLPTAQFNCISGGATASSLAMYYK